jgi:hypothetical protein
MSEGVLGLIAGFVSCGTVMAVYATWQTRKAIRDIYGPYPELP